eukprot:scaffold64590_cov61-Phaeocystis_antarctica.AAC.5
MSGAALADGKMIIWSCHTRGATLVSEVHSRGRWRRGRTHRERVGVDGDRAQPDLRERAMLVVDLAPFERVERVKAVDDLSKHGVCGRREGSGCYGRRDEGRREGGGRGLWGVAGDKELRAVGVRAAVGHRDDAPHGVLVVGMNLVVELAPPDALSALAGARGVAALQHEALDVAVEESVVIVARRGERQKVEGCARHDVAVDLELERAEDLAAVARANAVATASGGEVRKRNAPIITFEDHTTPHHPHGHPPRLLAATRPVNPSELCTSSPPGTPAPSPASCPLASCPNVRDTRAPRRGLAVIGAGAAAAPPPGSGPPCGSAAVVCSLPRAVWATGGGGP